MNETVVWPGGCIVRDVAYSVYCASCDERLDVTFTKARLTRRAAGTVANVARHLREQGWHTRRGLWVCPDCSQKEESQEGWHKAITELSK